MLILIVYQTKGLCAAFYEEFLKMYSRKSILLRKTDYLADLLLWFVLFNIRIKSYYVLLIDDGRVEFTLKVFV